MPHPSENPTPDAHGSQHAGPLRVGWILSRGAGRRLGRILEPLAVGLMDELIELTLILPSAEDAGKIPSPPVERIFYRPKRFWHARSVVWAELTEAVSAASLDVLHAAEPSDIELANWLGAACEVPFGVVCPSADRIRPLGRVNEFGEFLMALSEPIHQRICQAGILPRQHVHLIRPGVFPARQARCCASPDRPLSIMAGGPLDDPVSGLALLQCFRRLRQEHPKVLFFLTGSGPAERQLRKEAENLELTDVLTFLSGMADGQLSGLFLAADVYITPKRLAWYDLHALLAMASGLPVIASSDAADDFIQADRTARVFDPARSEQLLEVLEDVLRHTAQTRAMVERALEYLRSTHGMSTMTRQLAELYRQVAGMGVDAGEGPPAWGPKG